VREAFKLKFEPARDVGGRAIEVLTLWSFEWPAYYWLIEHDRRSHNMYLIPDDAASLPCRGDAPNKPVYRDCSQPDLRRAMSAPWFDGPDVRPAAPVVLQPRHVAIDKLQRTAGEPAIPPSSELVAAASGKPIAAAIIRLCLTADGKVDTTSVAKSSGVTAYDEQLQATIQATWAFVPPPPGSQAPPAGKRQPVCTSATFVTR